MINVLELYPVSFQSTDLHSFDIPDHITILGDIQIVPAMTDPPRDPNVIRRFYQVISIMTVTARAIPTMWSRRLIIKIPLHSMD